MDFKVFYKTVQFDIDKEIRTVLQVTQGDTKSRGLLVPVVVNSVVTPVTTETMNFFALKPDGTRVMTAGVKDGDKFRIDFTNQTFAVPGTLLCALVLYGTNGEKIADKKFKMIVDSSLEDGAIISKDERGILDRAFDLANDIVPRLEALDVPLLETVQTEVTDARKGKVSLGKRLDETDAQLAETGQRIDNIIATPIDLPEIYADEIHDARQGAGSLGANIAEVKSQLAENVTQVNYAYESVYKSSISAKNSSPTPTVVFVDDDGATEVLTELKPFAISKGIPWTLAIMPNSPILLNNEAELKELQDVYGWEVAAHNDIAVTTYTEDELNAHAKNISLILRSKGFNVNNYIYPNGLYSDLTEQVLSKYFRSASSTGQTTHNLYENMKMYELGRSATPSLTYENKLETLKLRVDNAFNANGLLIFTTHIWNMEAVHLNELSELIDYIIGKGMKITTLNKALDDFAPVISSGYYGDSDYFQIQRNGKVLSNRGKVKYAPLNAYAYNSPVTSFESNIITICEIDTTGATGFPENIRGILETVRVGTSSAYSYQTYKVWGTNRIYIRSAMSDIVWNGWSPMTLHNPVVNAYVASDLIIVYPDGITTFIVNVSGASGFPYNSAGIVTTYKVGGNGYYRQEFRRYNQNFIYTRYVDSNGNWTDWSAINSPLLGDTSSRPVITTVGTQYFDVTLGKPIWLKATGIWVDATGATV